MATWKFGDGSVLKSGGAVTGNGSAARECALLLSNKGAKVLRVAPPPSPLFAVDVRSDYLLDVLARDVAAFLKQSIETDYASDGDDAPSAVKALQDLRRDGEKFEIVGAIH